MHNHSNGNELRILMQIKLISLTIVEHQDSLRNGGKQQLGNGLFVCHCTVLFLVKWATCGTHIHDRTNGPDALSIIFYTLPKGDVRVFEFK